MAVKVYSTQTCPYCTLAKGYLAERGVEFEDVDVSADPAAAQEMIGKSGQMGVPQIDINGEMVVGFNVAAIDAALKR